MRYLAFIFATIAAITADAQQTRLGAQFEHEGTSVKEGCSGLSIAKVSSCAEVLFTGQPLHIAVGSLAPQNGIGVGGAFVYHWTPANWRNSLDMDAVGTTNGSWRAGAYFTAVWIRRHKVTVTKGPPPRGSHGNLNQPIVEEQPVFHVYAENVSLNKLAYFGIGPNTRDTNRSYFGMSEAIIGANANVFLWRPLNLSLSAEMNGRFVDIRGSRGSSSPSIEQLYTPATAPGLAHQSPYVQFGQGVQIRPTIIRDHVALNYSARFQEWLSSGESTPSFQRLIADFQHEYALYGTERSLLARPQNGPDDCSENPASAIDPRPCPPVALPPTLNKSRNLEGRINVRLLITESFTAAGREVPFYFQPTLGGSDINGMPALSSYQDYRFRGPNAILFRASFEHTILPRWPLGIVAMIDEGKVTRNRGDIDFSHLRHSYSTGLTLRAGGFPVVYLLFSWGGKEGTHTNVRIDTSLLGGSPRPSYY